MKILRASHLGFCFGVRQAIGMALDHPGPISVLGELVHNEAVLEGLRAQGVQFVHREPEIHTPAVMITAHGTSDRARGQLHARGLQVVEATCPLVRLAHRAVLKLAQDGFHPIVIGKPGHVEVEGLTGDLEDFDVVLTEEDVGRVRHHARFGVVSQTTQPVERVARLVALLRERFPRSEVRHIDTVCLPTKQRQRAAIELSLQADVVVVIGGANSNNTRELAATCSQYCAQVRLVQSAADLRQEWFAGAETVGVTAGTSTPDDIIAAVELRLQEFAGQSSVRSVEAFQEKNDHAPALAEHAV